MLSTVKLLNKAAAGRPEPQFGFNTTRGEEASCCEQVMTFVRAIGLAGSLTAHSVVLPVKPTEPIGSVLGLYNNEVGGSLPLQHYSLFLETGHRLSTALLASPISDFSNKCRINIDLIMTDKTAFLKETTQQNLQGLKDSLRSVGVPAVIPSKL